MRLRNPLLGHDLVAMAAPVTKWSVQVERADEIAPILRRAFKVATDAPQGPGVRRAADRRAGAGDRGRADRARQTVALHAAGSRRHRGARLAAAEIGEARDRCRR